MTLPSTRTIYYMTIVLLLAAIVLVAVGIIGWDPVYLWSAAGLAAGNATLGFWNDRRSGPAQHRRKDDG